ncbi:hypothetical protein Tco_0846777 [Tanacetum coccineum]
MKECTNWKDKKKDKEQEALLISEDTAFVITGENVGPKPKPDNEDNIADLISLGGVQKLMDWEFIVQVNFLTTDGWGTSNGKPFGLVRIADCGEISKDKRKKRSKYSSPGSEIESDSLVTDSYSEPDSDSSNDGWRQKKVVNKDQWQKL